MTLNKAPADVGVTLAILWPETAPNLDEPEDGILDEERLIVAERRAKSARLYQQKKTMRTIAAELKVSLGTVHRDIQAVLQGWRRFARQQVADLIVMELARLAHREADIEIEWEKSKGDLTETATGRRTNQSGSFDTAAVKKRQRCGNPQLAQLLLKCWEMRCKLLGLLRPEDFAAKGNILPPTKFVAGIDPVDAV